MAKRDDLGASLAELTEFIGQAPLKETISSLEYVLEGADKKLAQRKVRASGVSPSVLRAGFAAREHFGRVSDIIHAAAITLTLPHILEDGEVLERPSLAAGNDPSRPFDLETNRRVAEFKLARWTGNDAMRKRHLFKDLVHLAAEPSRRRAELYLLGERPSRFLRETKSNATWGLDRFPATQALFEARFGGLNIAIPDFTRGPAARVEIIDLESFLPELFAPGNPPS